ncbi:MAG: PRC-barrel domain-containing protein [Veillonellales bacterium]
MEKISSLLGLPVLEIETGRQIGEVYEVVVDIEQAAVCGIILKAANWFAQEQGIEFRNLHSIGRDAVMVRNSALIQELSTFVSSRSYHLRELIDKQIFTEAGLQLGTLVDIRFNAVTGEISDYQVSDSVVGDLLSGRLAMPLPPVQIVGEEKLIVPESMAKLLHTESDSI